MSSGASSTLKWSACASFWTWRDVARRRRRRQAAADRGYTVLDIRLRLRCASPPCTTFMATSLRSRRSCATSAPPASSESSSAATCCQVRCRANRSTRLLDLDIPVQFIQGNGDREVIAPTGSAAGGVPRVDALERRAAERRKRPADCGLAAHRARARLTDRASAVLSRDAAQRPGDLYASDARRAAAADFRDARCAAGGLRPHAHAVRSHDRRGPRDQCRQRRDAVWRTWRLLAAARAGRRAPPHPYDLEAAAERIRATKCPTADEFAARNVLQPPSEQDILAAFTNAGLK